MIYVSLHSKFMKLSNIEQVLVESIFRLFVLYYLYDLVCLSCPQQPTPDIIGIINYEIYKLVRFILSFMMSYHPPISIKVTIFLIGCCHMLNAKVYFLNSFVSPFSLVKEFKTTQSENSFDYSLSLIQKYSKD